MEDEQADMSGEEGRAREARRLADAGRMKMAEGMERAAAGLRGQASRAGDSVGRAGEQMAQRIDRSATYLRDTEAAEILDDVREYVRRHPIRSLVITAVAAIVTDRTVR